MSNLLKEDLFCLKNRLEIIDTQLEGQMKDLESREEKWKKMDEQVKDIIKNKNEILYFNVGGKKFATRIETLLSVKDTLFYKLILSGKFDLQKVIFFDRSPKIFHHILEFLRHHKINYKRFNKEQLDELKIESDYYEIGEISAYLEERMKEIEFVKFESSGIYQYNNQTAGTNRVEDLKDRSLLKGICSNAPGWIIIELNAEWDFDEIEIAGWNGNPNLWGNTNGSGASIQTSTDKVNWKTVGIIPNNFGNAIQNVKLTRSSARFVRFSHSSYLGIGYLNIKK